MATVHENVFGRIFISYRRDDASSTAGRLYDRLAARFGADRVFMDVDSISPGDDFSQVIENAVTSCNVVLALIGNDWLNAVDEWGRRRLDNPNDFVALEIKAGLDRNIPVIPILVDGATQVRGYDLPPYLAGLARRPSVRLHHNSFSADIKKLVLILERVLFAPRIDAKPLGEPGHPAMLRMSPDLASTSDPSRRAAWSRHIVMTPHFPRNSVPRRKYDPRNEHATHSKKSRRSLVLLAAIIAPFVSGAVWYGTHTAPASANVGDCFTQTGSKSLAKVSCTDTAAQFRVAGSVEKPTIVDANPDDCKAFPTATSAYWVQGESGNPGVVLCLEPVHAGN
jgi:TIR domain